MSVALGQAVVSLTQSPFPPLAVGFFGLGTGYLIWGPQELFHYPERDERVDFATGMWGIWMPGFMQFFAGIYLFARAGPVRHVHDDQPCTWRRWPSPPTACTGSRSAGTGCARPTPRVERGDDGRVHAHLDPRASSSSSTPAIIPVGGVFIGLTCVYFADFFASLGSDLPGISAPQPERALGFFRIGTACALMYLTFAVAGPQLRARVHAAGLTGVAQRRRLGEAADDLLAQQLDVGDVAGP